jgi:hypothetical protein
MEDFEDIVLSTGVIITKKYHVPNTNKHKYEVLVPFIFQMMLEMRPKRFEARLHLKLTEYPYMNAGMFGLCGNFDDLKDEQNQINDMILYSKVDNATSLFSTQLPPYEELEPSCNIDSLDQEIKQQSTLLLPPLF